MGAEVGCVLASIALGTGMVAGADRTPVTPTRGVGMGVAGCWFMATLTLGARTGTNNSFASTHPGSRYRSSDQQSFSWSRNKIRD